MSGLDVVNSAWAKLCADSTFLDYHGLTTGSTAAQKAVKVQKEMEPDGLTTDNVPLTCIYPIPGLRSKVNETVYDSMFEVAYYSNSSSGAKSATTKAGTMVMGDRGQTLLHGIQLSGDTIKIEFQSEFQTNSNVAGIKKFIQRYKVGEVIG